MLNRCLPMFILTLLAASCTYEHDASTADYPPAIGNIIVTKCAISGCHNTKSAPACNGLDLSSWQAMMRGGNGGAVVVPYSYSQSLLYLFTNTYPDLGTGVQPTMPYNTAPLTRDEVLAIRYWIDAGAANKNGFVQWSDNPQRRKYYIANKGCDVIATVDPASSLVMRYVNVGNVYEIEKPAAVKVAPDGAHWYVSFANGDVLQQFNTADDAQTGELHIGQGNWSSLCITSDSKTAYLVNTDSVQSEIAVVDLQTMTLQKKYANASIGPLASGASLDEAHHILYVGALRGNFVHVVNVTDPLNAVFGQLTMQTGVAPDSNAPDCPSSVFVNAAANQVYIACSGTGNLNLFSSVNQQLINTVYVGITPQTIAFDAAHNHVFVACTDDTLAIPGRHGYVAALDGSTLSVVDRIYTGAQPYGSLTDDASQRLVVANRNAAANGPPPHHHVDCTGRVGSFAYVDLNTLEWINEKDYEVSVEPFDIALRP